MKTIVILLFITLSFAFVPEPAFLESNPQDIIPSIPDILEEIIIEEPIKEAPRLQRQNAIRFPLSDSELSTDLETSDSDDFQVDQTYFYGLNSSFTDLYNEWNKEDYKDESMETDEVQEKEIVDKNVIKKSFNKVENVFEDIFDEMVVTLEELSQEAEEKKTVLGMDKSSFKELFKSTKEDFDQVFELASVALAQMTNQPNLDLSKETIKERFDEIEQNVDVIFDETLITLSKLAKEGTEKNTLFGFGKDDIQKIFGQAEENFEKIINNISPEFLDLLSQGIKAEESSDSDLSTDETDIEHTDLNGLNVTSESLSETDMDEILLAVRDLFNETIEEKALFNTSSDSEETDSFNVDPTYFNGLVGSALDQDSTIKHENNAEFNFDKVFEALSGLVKDAVEREKLLEEKGNE